MKIFGFMHSDTLHFCTLTTSINQKIQRNTHMDKYNTIPNCSNCWIHAYLASSCPSQGLISPADASLYTSYSFHNNYFNLALSSFIAPGSHQLVFIAYYLVLSFLLMYSSSGLSTNIFFLNKTNINTHHTECEMNIERSNGAFRMVLYLPSQQQQRPVSLLGLSKIAKRLTRVTAESSID